MSDYQVIVIGAGPAGYVAAIRCAQFGLKTACIDSWRDASGNAVPGGTCLNVGCIPSKALLDSSHHFWHVRQELFRHGVRVETMRLDLPQMMARKELIVKNLTRGVASLFRKNRVDWIPGHGCLLADRRVQVSHAGEKAGEQTDLSADHVIVATGSTPTILPQAVPNHANIVDSTGALELSEVPRRLVVIGAGVIGLELGSVWNRLGSEVLLLEAQEEFLPALDRDVSEAARKQFSGQGLQFLLGVSVLGVKDTGKEVRVEYEMYGEKRESRADKLIVATGRRPNTSGLGAKESGLALDERGFVRVNAEGRTNLEGVYAIGDVTGGAMLAHKASEEGTLVAERIAGKARAPLDPENVPWVIYTWPEIAWVGATERRLRIQGKECRTGSFPFAASGRARALGETAGMVKVVADARGERVLGVQIFGPSASELIAEAVLAMEFEASPEDIARTMHAHPTLSEAMREAALAAEGRALHI